MKIIKGYIGFLLLVILNAVVIGGTVLETSKIKDCVGWEAVGQAFFALAGLIVCCVIIAFTGWFIGDGLEMEE